MTTLEPTKTTDRDDLIVASVPVVDRIAATIARRYRLTPDDRDEFASWTRFHIVQNDYAVLRRFAGRSSLETYLAVVVVNVFRDYRNQRWGRWRPSEAARRHGPVAVELEAMVNRDRYPLDIAINLLVADDPALEAKKLRQLWAELPIRSRLEEISIDAIPAGDGGLLVGPVDNDAASHHGALRAAIQGLPAADQELLRDHYWNRQTVAAISKRLGADQKGLYRRLERIHRALKHLLERRGVGPEDV
jgi:RNA polymerase sigma factor (sigma-70 family)